MKLVLKESGRKGTGAFTLVEMMVVIAIVGILASLLMTAFPAIIKKANKAKVMAEFKKLEAAIEDYHKTYNSYPLDNPTNRLVNPLYYELQGTTWNAGTTTYDLVGDSISEVNVRLYFGQDGLRNVTHDSNDATAPKAKAFLTGLSSASFISVTNVSAIDLRVLRVPVKDTDTNQVVAANGDVVNVWHYNSSTPVYNKGKYDLWAEFESGGTRYRISNWEKDAVMIEDAKR